MPSSPGDQRGLSQGSKLQRKLNKTGRDCTQGKGPTRPGSCANTVNRRKGGHRRTPVIPTAPEAEAGGLQAGGQPQPLSKALSNSVRPCLQKRVGGWGCGSEVKCSWLQSPYKKNKTKQKEKTLQQHGEGKWNRKHLWGLMASLLSLTALAVLTDLRLPPLDGPLCSRPFPWQILEAVTMQHIFMNNFQLCSEINERVVQHFVHCIETHGRNVQYIKFLQTIVKAEGKFIKKCQDMVMAEVTITRFWVPLSQKCKTGLVSALWSAPSAGVPREGSLCLWAPAGV